MLNTIIMWTLIMHFGRGQSQTVTNLTKEAAQEHIRICVWGNEDCINYSCFKTI